MSDRGWGAARGGGAGCCLAGRELLGAGCCGAGCCGALLLAAGYCGALGGARTGWRSVGSGGARGGVVE
ncbi:hypothetical protein ACOSP7_022317 [Xanthoceras sorbifolium]